jgi:cellulose synthase/poly-beta-1,6-N-acetylglucosamine synthase-like glycosyltransferase
VNFVAEPVSWTEVPGSLRVLGRQRRRWHRGICEILIKHRGMIANPRYGRIGLTALPFYLVFEALAPLLELTGILLIPLGVLLGAFDVGFVLSFMLIAYGYAILVTLTALLIEEFSFRRYRRWSDLGWVLAAAVLENFGYRQLTCWWRVQGLWSAVRGRQHVWGTMTRSGFDHDARPAT